VLKFEEKKSVAKRLTSLVQMVSATNGPKSFVFKLLSKNIKIEIYSTLILPVVSYGHATRVSHIQAYSIQAEGVQKQGAERYLGQRWRSNRWFEKTAQCEDLHDMYSPINIVQVIK
jgi:hypothetical protein